MTLLDVYGSLYYAGARTLEAPLPDPAGSTRPVVIVRLRGRTALGATAFVILARYAQRVEAVAGRLYLSGVDPRLLEQLRRTRRVDVDRRVQVSVATEIVGDASALAYRQGEAWLARQTPC